jgi:hypothetical protein
MLDHTPLPWRYSERTNGLSAAREPKEPIVAEIVRIPEYKANARFIERACNSHYEMLACLETLRDMFQRNKNPEDFLRDFCSDNSLAIKIHNAIAKARGEVS